MHNQEGEAEDEYYRTKTGPVRDLLDGFGIDDTLFQPSGKSSLQTCLPLLEETHPLILVHNTCSTADDIAFAGARQQPTFWCLCPAANLYIEGRLPDAQMIAAATDNICIGTDSLASNTQLSILAELQILNKSFPPIGWETLLRWATSNGAKALHMESSIGTLTPAKKPGILHLPSTESQQVNRIA